MLEIITAGKPLFLKRLISSFRARQKMVGSIKEKKTKNHNKTVGRSLTSLDDWLNEQPNISKTVVGKHDNFNPKSNNRRDLTMPVYIRNYIDHPGDAPNPQNMRSKPSKAEITNSIQSMLTLIKNIS